MLHWAAALVDHRPNRSCSAKERGIAPVGSSIKIFDICFEAIELLKPVSGRENIKKVRVMYKPLSSRLLPCVSNLVKLNRHIQSLKLIGPSFNLIAVELGPGLRRHRSGKRISTTPCSVLSA